MARDWQGSNSTSPMPVMLARADVEAMNAYKTCPLCAPTLDHTDKRTGVKGWTVLKAGNLNLWHLGTAFNFRDGSAIGT